MPNNNIEYISEGKGETILFLHGWGQNKEMMLPLIDELKYKYNCVLIDLPGFGKSDFNKANNIDEYVDLIRDFLQYNKIFPSYIIGHSFGGKVCVKYYLKYRDLKKMVIIASPILKPKRTIKYYYKVYEYKLMKKINKNIKGGSEDYKNCSKEMKKFFINVVNEHFDKQVKNIDIPVYLIWGDNDKQVPLNKAKKLKKLIKHSELHVLKGNHFAYLENKELTKLIIQKFMRGGK